MDVWVLEWSNPSDMENDFTVWDNEIDARKEACKEIQNHISGNWDMDDDTQSQTSDEIQDLIDHGKYKEAQVVFNDYQSNYNEDYAQYWFVTRKTVRTNGGTSRQMNGMSSNGSTAGATCRGPCKTHNPYANADQADGTYMCRQCSTFHSIFGTAKP